MLNCDLKKSEKTCDLPILKIIYFLKSFLYFYTFILIAIAYYFRLEFEITSEVYLFEYCQTL